MLLVTWGHVTNALFSQEVVYYFPAKLLTATFAMPIYMWISGYFSGNSISRDSLKDYVVKRIKRLLLPCIIWNVLIWITVALIKAVLGGTIPKFSITGIWFLWALIICDIVFAIQVKLLRKEVLIIASSICISVLMIIIPTDTWYLAWVYPFFVLGYFSPQILGILGERKKSIWLITVALFLIAFHFYKPDYLVYLSGSQIWNGTSFLWQLGVDLYRFVIGVLGIVVFYGLSKIISDSFKENKLFELICNIGKISLQLYILQILIVEQLMSIVVRNISFIKTIMLMNYDYTCYFVAPIVTIIVVAFIMLIIRLIEKWPMADRILFGKVKK